MLKNDPSVLAEKLNSKALLKTDLIKMPLLLALISPVFFVPLISIDLANIIYTGSLNDFKRTFTFYLFCFFVQLFSFVPTGVIILTYLIDVYLLGYVDEVTLLPDKMTVKKRNELRDISFSDIISIKSFGNVFWGVSFKITTNNNLIFSFKTSILNPYKVIDAIYKYNPNLLLPEDYQMLIKKLLITDRLRYPFFLGKINGYETILIVSLYFFLSFFAVLLFILQHNAYEIHSFPHYFDSTFISLSRPSAFIALLFPLYFCGLYYCLAKLSRYEIENEQKILDYRFKIVTSLVAIFMINYIGHTVFVYATNENLVFTVKTKNEHLHIAVKKGDVLKIDSRFSWFNSPYSLQKGDLIAFEGISNKGFAIGRLTSVPKESALALVDSVDHSSSTGRRISSEIKTITIPENHIAVETKLNDEVQNRTRRYSAPLLIKREQIIGKVEKK